MSPVGLYFLPARNGLNSAPDGWSLQSMMGWQSTLGDMWPSRSLFWTALGNRVGVNSENLSRAGSPATRSVGRLQAHRWTNISVTAKTKGMDADRIWGQTSRYANHRLFIGRKDGYFNGSGRFNLGGFGGPQNMSNTHWEPSGGGTSPNHLRFGEIAAGHVLNYVADATFAQVRTGGVVVTNIPKTYNPMPPNPPALGYDTVLTAMQGFFSGSTGPAAMGRYLKESGASFRSPLLPAGILPLRLTWTEIPSDLWFDSNADGWMGDDLAGVASDYKPLNDRFKANGSAGANGLRDVHIEIEAWDDLGTASTADDRKLATFCSPGGVNLIPSPSGRMYYRAVFVSELSAAVRAAYPLDATPFLDDVTVFYLPLSGGLRIMSWGEELRE